MHPRTTTNVPGVLRIIEATSNHLVKCSGIEAAIMRLCRGLNGYHQLEQGTHTCLDIVLNDKRYIKNLEEREEIRGGMGRLWRTCLGRKPGVRKGH